MNCPDFNTLMMFLDGELGEERLKEVSEHVILCDRCRNLIDSQRNLETSWRDSFVTPEDDKFRSMEWYIFKRINRRSRWKTFVPAAAGIIAVLLGVKLILDNKPSLDRVTELSRSSGIEYVTDSSQFEDVRDESTVSGINGFDSEETDTDASITAPTDHVVSTEDILVETTSEQEGYFVTDGESTMPQSAMVEEGAGETLRGMGSLAQETDRQAITGGEVTTGGSGGIGSAGSFEYVNEEEYEETEIPEEIIFMGVVDGGSLEEQVDDISETITLSLDADTTGLATGQTVASSVSPCEEAQDNRASNQSFEYHSRFFETSDEVMDTLKEDIYVELVFDADGQPDSSTAFLLDSLFAGWSDYISFVYRDTVLVIPLASIQQLFIDGNLVPAETIE